MVTLKDIAEACGVSISTVSRAFDNNSRISQSVRQQIQACAADMGYTPNQIARSLKCNRTMSIALIIPSIENSFYIDVLEYLEVVLHQYGYRLLVTFVHEGITTEKDCLELAASAQVDGIILISYKRDNEQLISRLQKHIKIIQLFHLQHSQVDSVVMDDNAGAEAAVNYLISNNHRRIIYVGGDERRAGVIRAIKNANIPMQNLLMLPIDVSMDEVCRAIVSFKPTAFFSVAMANETVWSAVRNMNLSIPEDISMIAYDNTKWVSLLQLTTVAHNLEEIATTVVSQLLQRINGDVDSDPQHIVLNPFIIERKSVRKLSWNFIE